MAMCGLGLPNGEIAVKRNGEWESFGFSDGENEQSIHEMNDRIWRFPVGTQIRYCWAGNTIEFTIKELRDKPEKPKHIPCRRKLPRRI